MFDRRVQSLVLTSALLFPVVASGLDKEEKAWLEDVKPIILPSEEKIFNSLKSKEDRAEFQKIFWARRDPDLLTPENEFQKIYAERREKSRQSYSMKEADKDLGIFLPISGDQTDCGITHIVLGPPTSTAKHEGEKKTRDPEKWVYAPPVNSTFYFDGHCRFPQGSDKVREQLREHLLLQSDVNYHVEKGKLTKSLADMLPKPGPAQAILLQPRQDFPLATEPAFMKIQEGGTGVFGLVKGEAKSITTEKKLKAILRAEAKRDDGTTVVFQRDLASDVDATGSFIGSYRLPLKPGNYMLKVGVVDPVSNKGSVVTQPLEVPDFNKDEITISTLFALEDMQEVTTPDPNHPFSAFEIGTARLVPRFGNVFKQSDALHISYQFYDPKIDATTQKPSTAAKLTILKPTGGPAAEAPEQTFDTVVAGGAVGPVALAKYPPGKYKILLKVTDKVAQKEYTRETAFEIQPDATVAK
jgi:GWxTD domain-containing protein